MLFEPLVAASLRLANRTVMAPMTRSRALDANTPNALMAEYYAQRATAGLIVTEGTSPSPNGLGYPRIPGLFNDAQVRGWKAITDAVHAKGGKIFVQLMHTGRVTQVANLPAGAQVLGPMAKACPGEMYTDSQGMQAHSSPRAMTAADIAHAVDGYAKSAQLAIEAGFDGVELHAANDYLIEQVLNANVNQRTDAYGGSIQGRNRFALEVARATCAAIGAHRVGIRLSPYGVFNSTGVFPDVDAQYLALVQELSTLNVRYVHLLDHSAMGAPAASQASRVTWKNVPLRGRSLQVCGVRLPGTRRGPSRRAGRLPQHPPGCRSGQLGSSSRRRARDEASRDHIRQSRRRRLERGPGGIDRGDGQGRHHLHQGHGPQKKVDLFGFSMGGRIAQEVVLMEPQLVRRMIITGTGPAGGEGISKVARVTYLDMIRGWLTFQDPKQFLFFTRTPAGIRAGKEFLQRLKERSDNGDKEVTVAALQAELKALRRWGAKKPADLSTKVHHAILVANGHSDRMVPSKNTHDLAQRLPNSELIIYPDSGHGAVFQFHADFVPKALAFLSRQSK